MCPIPEASKTEGRTVRTSEVLGRSTGVVSPNPPQTRGPPSARRPPPARLVSLGDAPRQRSLLLPGVSGECAEADLLLSSLHVPQILANLEQGLAEDGAASSIAQENRQGQCRPRAGPGCPAS